MDNTQDFITDQATATAFIVATVQIAKNMGMSSRIAPLFAFVMGIVIGVVKYAGSDPESMLNAIMAGGLMGASAVGIYRASKEVSGQA